MPRGAYCIGKIRARPNKVRRRRRRVVKNECVRDLLSSLVCAVCDILFFELATHNKKKRTPFREILNCARWAPTQTIEKKVFRIFLNLYFF